MQAIQKHELIKPTSIGGKKLDQGSDIRYTAGTVLTPS